MTDTAQLTFNQLRDLFNAYEDTEGANWKATPGAVESDDGMLICDSGDWGGHVLDAHTNFIALAHQHMPALLEIAAVATGHARQRPRQKKWWFVRFVAESKRFTYAFFQHERPVKDGNSVLRGAKYLEVEETTKRSRSTAVVAMAIDAARRGRGPICVGNVKGKTRSFSKAEWRKEVSTGTTLMGYEDWHHHRVRHREVESG